MFKNLAKWTVPILATAFVVGLSACSSGQSATKSEPQKSVKAANVTKKEEGLKNNIQLSKTRGTVRQNIEFTAKDLGANKPVELTWTTADGKYIIKDLYSVIGPDFKQKEVVVAKGTSDANGEWKGSFIIPVGFGGDTTIYVKSDKKKIGQVGFKVDPTFTISPESGPAGSMITVKVEGIGWSTYARNWQLTYDNKYTGLITAISTNGTAEAKFRAAGNVGKHAIRIRTGYLGSPYINYQQSPYADKPAPEFIFNVTNEKAVAENYVEPSPQAANGGLEMPKLKNQTGVAVKLDKNEGTVGEPVKITATGLPKDKNVDVIFNTMRGSRVSGLGFGPTTIKLGTVKTDGAGNLNYDFSVPDDLGGIPHRIDLKLGDKVYGQEYLRILPSIANVSPASGLVGTHINVTIKGGGWTEFDNAYYLTYDNAYAGYVCAFNSHGDVTFDVVATGDPGYHIIDLYPGIYKQKIKDTDMTLIPQLTYQKDHPGSAMPAIRLGFEITK